MWVFLPIVSLLIRVILGYPETDSTLSDMTQLENEGNDTLDNRLRKSAIDASKDWKKEEPYSTVRNKKQTEPSDIMSGGPRRSGSRGNEQNHGNSEHARGIGSNVKIVAKRRESLGPWHDSQPKDKGIQNPAHEMKDPWIYWWGDKRISLYGSSPSIRRPIRVPFNSWAGKRGKDFSRSNVRVQSKRTELAYDQDDPDTYEDVYGVKGIAEVRKIGRKTPFNSWGGKRARKPADREPDRQQLVLMTKFHPNNRPTVLDTFKDKFAKGGEFGNEADAKQMVQTNKLYQMRAMLDKWDNKRNCLPYRFPLRVINETTEKDYMTDGDIAKHNNINNDNNNDDDYDDDDEDGDGDGDDGNWLMTMSDKRAKHGQLKKTAFDPWGGKRSLKTYAFRFGDEYFAMPVKGRKIFFPRGG